MRVFIKKIIKKHWALTFLIMCISSLTLGLSSYNLFFLFNANLMLIADYGSLAIMEGALRQLFELICYGVISIAAYIILKACEKVLVETLLK